MDGKQNLIYKVEPKAGEEIKRRKPKIKIYINNKSYKSNLINIKMYLNGKEVKFKKSKDKLKYTPKEKLKSGRCTIGVLIKLDRGEVQEYKWEFYIKNKEGFNFYFGSLHSHTAYSSGQGTPTDAFNNARKMGLDFWAVTDHARSLKKPEKWKQYRESCNEFNKKYKKILCVYGKEISVREVGHLNLFNCDNENNFKINSLDKLESVSKKYKDIIFCINHPGKSIYALKNKRHLNDNICLMELGNGRFPDKYNRYEKYYYSMLDEKWYIGAVNGQDNHKKDWGKWDNLTVIISPKLNEKCIFSALKNRRTYSTESGTLKLKFMLEDNWMGSIVKEYKKGDKLEFSIECEDREVTINKVQIITNNGKILCEKEFNKKNKISWNPIVKLKQDNTWYVLKVLQDGDRMAISSPIFIENI